MKKTSPLEDHRGRIEQWIEHGWSNRKIANHLDTAESSVRRARKRWHLDPQLPDLERPLVDIQGDSAVVESGPIGRDTTHDELLRIRGLRPEDWIVDGLRVSDWDGPSGAPMKAERLTLRRRHPQDMIFPAREAGSYRNAAKPRKPLKGEPRLVVFVGDQQAPYHHPGLHEAFCHFLEEVQPHEGVLIGDTMDFPVISRHPAEPEWAATTQQCVDAAYTVVRDYVQASESTSWRKLAGNHDERLRRAVIDKIGDLHELTQAERDVSIFSPAHLLRLDELGVEYVDPKGGYKHAQVRVSDYLAARHGWVARKGSGASALATLEHLGYSVVVGHTHRQSLVHKTRHDIHGALSTLAAVEAGCMCRIEEGLGYAVAPDWQNGFVTAAVFPSGQFHLELGTFVNDVLYWRNNRYA